MAMFHKKYIAYAKNSVILSFKIDCYVKNKFYKMYAYPVGGIHGLFMCKITFF